MEYKNKCNCPRDMVDGDLLRMLLSENESCCGNYGNNERRERPKDSGCGCREKREEMNCGCRNMRENREICESRESREESGCGCRNMRENRESREESNCGCRDNDRDNRRRRCCDNNMNNGGRRMRRENEEMECECGEKCAMDQRLAGFPLAMVYSPDQEWKEMFCDEEALDHGTLFRELDLPFYPSCDSCKNK